MTENKYKEAKEEGIVRPLTILLDLEAWSIVLTEYKKQKKKNRRTTYADIVNELIKQGAKK